MRKISWDSEGVNLIFGEWSRVSLDDAAIFLGVIKWVLVLLLIDLLCARD